MLTLKSQLITFGGYNPSSCAISLDGNPIPWVTKVKYSGVQLICNTGIADVSDACRRFMASLIISCLFLAGSLMKYQQCT